MNVAAAATRCQTKAGKLYVNPHWDLVDATKQKDFDLAKIEKQALPESLRGLTTEQLAAHVADKRRQRSAIQAKVKELGAKRDGYVAEQRKRQQEAGEKAFDSAVLESVREQAASRGFEREPAPTSKPESKPESKPAAESAPKPATTPPVEVRSQVAPQRFRRTPQRRR